MKLITRLLQWMEYPIHLMLWGSLIAGTLMMLHVSADVAGRTVFSRPLAGTTEIVSAWYMVAVAYLPWAWLARHDQHIVAGLFQRIGSDRFSAWVEIAVKLLTMTYLGVFAQQTYLRAVQQTRAGEVWEAAGGHILVWPTRWLLPLCAGLMALYLLLRVISDLPRALHGGGSEPA
jgi:TRAP-type C4-dicarboxylate transport system permease small subunit